MYATTYEQNIVIDFEFTTIPRKLRPDGLHFEIIEVGAVRVSADGQILDEFRSMVCPQYAPGVSFKVSDLTGIIDADVCNADSFEAVINRLSKWIGTSKTRMVAWSDSDRKQVLAECSSKGVGLPQNMQRWLDLQRIVPKLLQVGRAGMQMSLRDAAGWVGVDLTLATEHRALDDAKHTAEILAMVMTGDYREQKRALAAAMPGLAHTGYSASVGAGLLSSALEALYSQMVQNQALTAA